MMKWRNIHRQASRPASQPHKETEDGESTWQDRQFMKDVEVKVVEGECIDRQPS